MEGHRVVRLDVVCYVIVGLGVSGFAWFGSVGLARCGLSSYGVSGCGQERFVEVCQVW